jgi:hypothetical protein
LVELVEEYKKREEKHWAEKTKHQVGFLTETLSLILETRNGFTGND